MSFWFLTGQDFKLAYKEIDQVLKRSQVRPLAVGVHPDRQLLQFCYTSEVADGALKILDEAGLPGELRLRQGLALVAMVGAGVTRNPLHCHRFWQQLKGRASRIHLAVGRRVSVWLRYCAPARRRA